MESKAVTTHRLLDRLFGKAEEINGQEGCPTFFVSVGPFGDAMGKGVLTQIHRAGLGPSPT